MGEPPNYRKTIAVNGRFCRDCEFYDASAKRCLMYDVPVIHYYSCASWKRNPSLPVKFS